MTTEASTKIVCDAGPIIHLDELDCLKLLVDFEEVLAILRALPAQSTLYFRPALLNEIITQVESQTTV